MNKQNLLVLLLVFFHHASAQQSRFIIPDSLKHKSYGYLDDRIYGFRRDSSRAAVYLFTYIHKAKKEKNWKELVNGYRNLLHESPDGLRPVYADSMVYAARKSNDDALIGSAYLSKGIVFYGRKDQEKAMDNYLMANSYISKTNDDYQKYKVKYHIALTKLYIGFYDEAISLLRECAAYYRNKNTRPYLNSLHTLGLCYNKNGNYGLCTQTNALGINESRRLDNLEMIPYFMHSQGINEFFLKNYSKSIKDIESSLGAVKENRDFANQAIGNFYIGKSYWALGRKAKAAEYFKMVDKIFKEKNYLRPDLRQSFELLINYYRQKKDLASQLYYVDQLLKADTLLVETNRYIVGKIHKQYDTRELLQEKENLQRESEDLKEELVWEKNYDQISLIIFFFMFSAITIITYRYYKNRRLYKKRFEEYINKMEENKNKPKNETERLPAADIKSGTAALILRKLEKFEKENKFLERDWKQGTLAAYFNSNSNYLAGIIKQYRGKNFADYINGLRIDYLVALLQNEKKYSGYSNEALAQEAGFSSTQRFANAFLSKMGMPAVYFIEQIKKKNY